MWYLLMPIAPWGGGGDFHGERDPVNKVDVLTEDPMLGQKRNP